MCNSSCIFCDIVKNINGNENVFMSSEMSLAMFDAYPKTKGHSLVITKKHFANFLEVDDNDLKDAMILAKQTVKELLNRYPDIKGFNYVSNQNAIANQVVFHFHLHIIPRY